MAEEARTLRELEKEADAMFKESERNWYLQPIIERLDKIIELLENEI